MQLKSFIRVAAISITATAGPSAFAENAADDQTDRKADSRATEAVYEIRSYHFEPELLEDYRAWITEEGLPYISRHVDVVGFWIDNGVPPEIAGMPIDDLGSANVTWVIRWPSIEERHERIAEVFSGPEWEAIFSRVPGDGDGYLRVEARFASAVPLQPH